MSLKTILFDLLLVGLIASWFCLYRIDAGSFAHGDQTTHSLVVQNMVHTGDLLHPQNRGRPYLNKPPFKMWLNTVPVRILGESNLSYRILDGALGVALFIFVFGFASDLLRSRLAGYLSVTLLLCAKMLFIGHGFRVATQDGMLLFLSTVGIAYGYRYFETFIDRALLGSERNRSLSYSVAALGITTGFAILTKSIAGLIAPLIVMVLFILAGKTWSLIRERARDLLVFLPLAFGPPLLYFGYRAVQQPKFLKVMFASEIFERASSGFHNVGRQEYYLLAIFDDYLATPPILLGLALCYGIFRTWRKDLRYLFLLIWAALPVLLYSAASSKIYWYIMPAIPGMAILSSALLNSAITRIALRDGAKCSMLHQPATTRYFQVASALIVVLIALYEVPRQIITTAKVVTESDDRTEADILSEWVLAQEKSSSRDIRALRFRGFVLTRDENLYWNMIGIDKVRKRHQLQPKFASANYGFALAAPRFAEDLLNLGSPTGYLLVPPRFERRDWLLIVTYFADNLPKVIRPIDETTDMLPRKSQAAWGFSAPFSFQNQIMRQLEAKQGALIFTGDLLRSQYGTETTVDVANTQSFPITLKVYLNHVPVYSTEITAEDFNQLKFEIPSGIWESGSNQMIFEVSSDFGTLKPHPLLVRQVRNKLRISSKKVS